MKKKAKRNYVDNEKLYEEMVKFVDEYNLRKEANEDLPIIPNYIGDCILKVAENLAKSPNFSGYTFRADMISDGYLDCCKYLQNFNYVKYKSPFTYFTTICFWAFVRRIKKEEKERYIKIKSMINSNIFSELASYPEEELKYISSDFVDMYADNYSDFVKEYEEKLEKKKKDKPKKGVSKFIKEEPEEDV